MKKLNKNGRLNVKIIWAKSARQDLKEIETYIAEDNQTAAYDTILKIIDKVETLLTIGTSIGRAGRIIGTRELVIQKTPYIVIYSVLETNINILRVIHEARKWTDNLLK